jgi:hypothetical protein
MNTFRSPAPTSALLNFGNSRSNAGMNFIGNTMNGAVNAVNSVGDATISAVNSVANAANSAVNSVANIIPNAPKFNVPNFNVANTNSGAKGFKGPSTSQIVLIVFFIVVVTLLGVFWHQVQSGFIALYDKVRAAFGAQPTPPYEEPSSPPVTATPEAPQDDTTKESNMVEKILPGRQEVFNISKNSYTYYDAEPLCKAIGAELATYEQVKEAYAKGADWCNYGWTKGQMAVYPTQQSTYESLQQGPEAERGSCGRTGLNGGFFDNPELRFGVNCYGVKPPQKDHDATVITSGEGAPLSPGMLEFDKKVNKYRGDASSIGVLPWNKTTWSN